ncbi:hypothetical protein I5535_14615 [Rhodobacteraceae bacterium F11138]|nr:hypothetical protein [Rhodobacteraceae bacterium F11138]
MLAFLFTSIIGGFVFACTSIWLGYGFWAGIMWYMIGCWVGFLLPLIPILLRKTNSIFLNGARHRAAQR